MVERGGVFRSPTFNIADVRMSQGIKKCWKAMSSKGTMVMLLSSQPALWDCLESNAPVLFVNSLFSSLRIRISSS